MSQLFKFQKSDLLASLLRLLQSLTIQQEVLWGRYCTQNAREMIGHLYAFPRKDPYDHVSARKNLRAVMFRYVII